MNLTSAPRPFAVFLSVMFTFLAVQLATASELEEDELSAEQIIKRMDSAYSECTSYADSGSVRTVYTRDNFEEITDEEFATVFVRPDRFRFELNFSDDDQCIIFRRGQSIRTWWSLTSKIEKNDSLRSAFLAAAGPTAGDVHPVPVMLMHDEVGGRRITEMSDVRRLSDARLGQADCFCIEGLFAGTLRSVWIDKENFLVRRVDLQRTVGRLSIKQTTTYEPIINVAIAKEMLQFGVP